MHRRRYRATSVRLPGLHNTSTSHPINSARKKSGRGSYSCSTKSGSSSPLTSGRSARSASYTRTRCTGESRLIESPYPAREETAGHAEQGRGQGAARSAPKPQTPGHAGHRVRRGPPCAGGTELVLAETALLAFERVGKRFRWAVVRAAQDAPAAAVIEQRVHGFLQHAFFVAHDHVRRVQFDELFQPVVAVDHTAIEIVQIGSSEAARQATWLSSMWFEPRAEPNRRC
jgi:hypothetical protein